MPNWRRATPEQQASIEAGTWQPETRVNYGVLEWNDPTRWADGLITVDEGKTIVPAQFRTDFRWNGWLCPRMTFDNAVKVLDAITSESPDYYRYEVKGTEIIVIRTDGDVEEVDETYGPDDLGLYHIGSWSWCWEIANGFIYRAEADAKDEELYP